MSSTTSIMQALAWSLLHFLWQGAAIAAVAASVMFVLRKPATRYLVGMGALALMLVSFGVTFSLISATATSAEFSAAGAPAAVSPSTLEATVQLMAPAMDEQAVIFKNADFAWISRAWLAGVFIFALRIAFGLLVLEHLRRRNLVALPPALVAKFEALQQRLGISRAIRYCECHLLRVPAVIGFLRPIVLLPMRAMTGLTPEQIEAVIAHELGHIKRFDVIVNFFQVIAETLFFFHPAVWWLNKHIRADREDCCDDVAISACGGPVAYARALATMEGWRDAPSLAMAATGSPVAARVARLLGVKTDQDGARAAGVVTASLVLATAIIGAAISVGIAIPASAQVPPPAPAPVTAPLPATLPALPPAPAARPVKEARAVPAVKAAPAQKAQKAQKAEKAQPAEKAAHEGSFIDEMASVGLTDLDVDDLIALKIQGVDAAYVRAIRGTGLTPDVGELIAMKIHGVTPEYVKEIRAAGFAPDTQELVAMKIHGVTPEYQRALAAAGYKMDTDQLIQAKIMDVTPEFIDRVNAHGFKNLTPEKLIQLKNADIL